MSYVDAIRGKDTIEVVERLHGERIYRSFPMNTHFYVEREGGTFRSIYGKELQKMECNDRKHFFELLTRYKASEKAVYEGDLNPIYKCLSEHYINSEPTPLNVAFFDIETDMQPYVLPSRCVVRAITTYGEEKHITIFELTNHIHRDIAKVCDVDIEEANRVKGYNLTHLDGKWVDLANSIYFEHGPGYGSTDDPFMPVTAIAVYQQWTKQMHCLALCPGTLTLEQAKDIGNEFDHTTVYTNEREMFERFFELIEDSDVLSGWNSESYDIPYLVNRVSRIMGRKHTSKFCLWDKLPKPREFEKFGATENTYDLVGRVHLDSLALYRKYTYEERHSYKLDSIAEYELGERKIEYDGTLEQLYNSDFRKFIEYNRQDCALLDKLDQKLKFIDLANSIAHETTVLLQTTMGAVAVTEQAIVNEAHRRGLLIPDRPSEKVGNVQAAGAYVSYPRVGLHKWLGSVDLNSLYPSVLRALNCGPETIVGHIRPVLTDAEISYKMEVLGQEFATAWEGKFGTNEFELVMSRDNETMLLVDWEDGTTSEVTGSEIYTIVYESGKPWILSANGTVFTYERESVIAGLLSRWYSERKLLQKELARLLTIKLGYTPKPGLLEQLVVKTVQPHQARTTPTDIYNALEESNVAVVQKFIDMGVITVDDGKIVYLDKTYVSVQEEYWDKRQLVKKLMLNSLYGSILNPGCRFFDKRIGQTTTLTGRRITRHMTAEINEIITGKYDHLGESVYYNDTDSCYFSAYPTLKPLIDSGEIDWNKDTVIEIYNAIAEQANATFPKFMLDEFNVPVDRGAVIRAGREIVGETALFITKKRYAILYYDKDNNRYDTNGKPGKIKAMGLDLRRSDTPTFVQDFLSDILNGVLLGKTETQTLDDIREFRMKFKELDGWEKGSPKRANKISHYNTRLQDNRDLIKQGNLSGERVTVPGHVTASINWNLLRKMNGDIFSQVVTNGAKVIVCKLKPNIYKMTSIARPVDQSKIPEWFRQLPFDNEEMEEILIDKKISNLLCVLDYDLSSSKVKNMFASFFRAA